MAAKRPHVPEGTKLQAPLARLLRPLVRLLIKAGVTFPALCDLLSQLYINVAEHDFALPDKPQTDSRVSLLTGIHRKEVARQRGAGAPIATVPSSVSRASQILALWLGSPHFTDATGAPCRSRAAKTREARLLTGEVSSVTKDVRPRAVLRPMARPQTRRARRGWPHRLARRRPDARGRRRAALLLRPQPARPYRRRRRQHQRRPAALLQRAVHYDRLSAESAAALVEFSREQANHMLLAANRQALAICDLDGGGSNRWILGVYVYRADQSPPKSEEDAP